MTTNGTSFSKTFNDKKMGKFDDKNLGMTQNGSRLQWTSFVFFFKRISCQPHKIHCLPSLGTTLSYFQSDH
jgi:hypothetical protein